MPHDSSQCNSGRPFVQSPNHAAAEVVVIVTFCRQFSAPKSVDPVRTAAPLWGQTTSYLTGLSQKRDCGPNRVERFGHGGLRRVRDRQVGVS